ncbi:unnamed protein product [Peronospora belbahrii]|uniref:Uncharacterized protein n=1 Tax=Peronospora belbahrii TaxID=622444 RepID=A0AAU9LA83_9STRA|nr:unnamed protein product [Peronospora belbahrii]CAH0522512.1 unnamed protein product [Peronospora belbahrii]
MRTLSAYCNALSFIVQSTGRKLQPDEIVCNFDTDLFKALHGRFPIAIVRGSMYRLKQACRTKMEQLKISDDAINLAMEKGVLDMLATIPSGRVATAGISWVKQQMKTKCASANVPYMQSQWRLFWLYFRNTWCRQFSPEVWNMHGLSNRIIARTNNPLEQLQKEVDVALPCLIRN